MRKKFKVISIIAIFSLVISLFTPTLTTQVQAQTVDEKILNTELTDLLDNSSIELLNAIENMPESVINQGSSAMFKWLKANITDPTLLHSIEVASKQSLNKKPGSSTYSVSCGLAIATGLVTLFFAPAKILKMKKAIEALGGAYKLAEKAVDYYKVYRNTWGLNRVNAWDKAIKQATKQIAPDLQEAVLDLLGVATIISTCTE